MIKSLPFGALRVFESAARHLSFKLAAEELFTTPAAVSQQIKTLEHQLGVKLFNRHNRDLSLTDEAKHGMLTPTQGFDNLIHTVDLIRGADQESEFAIWIAPSFVSGCIQQMHYFR